MSNLMMTE